jgi:hypothetical protein
MISADADHCAKPYHCGKFPDYLDFKHSNECHAAHGSAYKASWYTLVAVLAELLY